MSTMYINNIVNDTTIVQSNRSDGRLVRWLNFCFVVEKNQLAACSTHTLRSDGLGVRGEDLHLLLGCGLPALVVARVLIKVSQPHDFVLLGRALELDDAVRVVLHGEELPLVPDTGLLVDPDLF